jgi:hypothetical protein
MIFIWEQSEEKQLHDFRYYQKSGFSYPRVPQSEMCYSHLADSFASFCLMLGSKSFSVHYKNVQWVPVMHGLLLKCAKNY